MSYDLSRVERGTIRMAIGLIAVEVVKVDVT
jgi:hypothetical protein